MGRKLFFGMALSVSIFFLSSGMAMAAYRDDNPDFDGTLIEQDTVWHRDGQYVFDKPVIVVDGAKLVIKPGTHVVFKRMSDGWLSSFEIYDGSVEAIGTADAPVFFERATEADAFYIDFSDLSDRQSVFRYVHIVSGGERFGSGGGSQAFLRDLFMNKALAYAENGMAAVMYWGGKLTIEDSVFSESPFADVWAYDSQISDWDEWSAFLVKHSDFNGPANIPAIYVEDSYCDNFLPQCPRKITFENNWYGDSSGPKAESNPSGTGKEIVGTINLIGWNAAQFFCTENCYSNVMFLPGLEASRLYAGVGSDKNQLWEPNREADAENLLLDENGKSLDSGIYTKDIIDEKNVLPIGQGNIYKSFINEMNEMRDTDHLINDWKAIPYDWRFSLDDILSNGKENNGDISYIGSVSQPFIIQELERLAGSSKSGKVTIIAHSNGGLVAKALIRKLGDAEAARLIDKVVLVAVPQSGTPQAIGALLHGYDQGLPFDWLSPILSTKTARLLANNMPGVYHLLPSEMYFSGEGSGSETPPIIFDDGALTDRFIGKYDHGISDASELRDFLSNNDGKVSADSEDVTSPSRINAKLLAYGEDIHRVIDSMTIPQSISVYQIAGFGEETLGTIRYWTNTRCIEGSQLGGCLKYAPEMLYTPDGMIDGDGTVVAPSALSMSTGASNVMRYWVNLDGYNNELPGSLSRFDRKHADILEVQQLRDFIKNNIITQLSSDFPAFISDSRPSANSEKRLRYYLHSPLALSVRDSDGHEMSVTASDIPGARYRHFGEVQYISVPASAHPTLMLDGEANGSFTLEVQETEGDTVMGATTFSGIPSTEKTRVTMDFSDGTIEHASPLAIDYDGNGTEDHLLVPVLGGIVLLGEDDTTPPATSISLSGIRGLNDWHVSDVTVVLAAEDNADGSGVEKTEYSLDNGVTWVAYAEPFVISQEGNAVVRYFSTDKQGNKEEAKEQAVKIDKAAPEAKIAFNKATQKLDITGTDNLSAVSVVILEKSEMTSSNRKMKRIKSWFSEWHEKHRKNLPDMLATLTDDAGHVTSLAFEKKQDRNGALFIRLQSIGYDGDEAIVIDDVKAQYKWQFDKKTGKYRSFEAHLKTDSGDVESRYVSRKNETWIMEKPEDIRDDEHDDDYDKRSISEKIPGMVVLYMETSKGKVNVKY